MKNVISSLLVYSVALFKKQIDNGKQNVVVYKKLKQLLKTDYAEFKKQYAEQQSQEQIAQERSQLVNNNNSNATEFEKWKDPKNVLSSKLGEFLTKTQGNRFCCTK